MGFIKDDYLEILNRGYGHCDKIVCHDCVGNLSLKSYIKSNGRMDNCNYCGRRRVGVALEDLMPAIMDGVFYIYDHAINQLPYDSGEYVGKTYSKEDVINSLYEDINIEDKRIIADILEIMNDDLWCDAQPFSENEEDTAFYDWQAFCKMVKEEVRFVFYQAGIELDSQNNPAAILDTIANYAEIVNLTRRIDKNTKLYRCRTHNSDEWFVEVSDFAPPPTEHAKPGRMNAEGINVLYLTLDPETALKETNVCGRDYASIASMRIKEPIYVLDLSKIKTIQLPSVFDCENRNKRSPILFLQKFAESISQQSIINGIDYVPTQIVTEYFRYVQTKNKRKYAGILYDSVQNPGGKCLALFVTREDFLNGKYGIHILPKQSLYYEKKFELIPQNVAVKEETKLFINSKKDTTLKKLTEGASDKKKEKDVKKVVDSCGKIKISDLI